jgi:hypothetical protein
MESKAVNGIKDFGLTDQMVQSVDQIFRVFPLKGASFTGKYIFKVGKLLAFEKNDGTRVLIHPDAITFAAEVAPRRQ